MAKATALRSVQSSKLQPRIFLRTGPLQSVEEVESAVASIAAMDREISAIQTSYDARVAALGEEIKPRIDPLLSARAEKEQLVLDYAREHREEIKGKTWKLRFAVVKFSKAAARVVFVEDLLVIISRLKKHGMLNLVKTYEDVDKNELRDVDPLLHAKLGFEIVPSEEKAKLEIDATKFELNELQKKDAARAAV